MHKHENSDIKLYEGLFLRHFKALCAFVYSYLPDIEAVKDIVQETFLALWDNRDKYSPTSALLFTVAKNKTLDYLKAHSQTKTLKGFPAELFIEKLQSSREEEMDTRQILEEVWKYVETLPPQCRTIFLMSRRENLKNREIAVALDISVKAVEKQIAKAQGLIREHLLKHGVMALITAFSMFNFTE